ncbi:hypothetical protein SAMN05444411_102239 [Lutibacter oricola]|uniref:Uncharacterized protein n=1 Tax=Lutibacter oricola TaxID=762486 RepID=A0A1H2WMW7_9FLAO|nr:hypothetical protein [Lutibacter oricola]SDW81848.1 hypothetical protein SAMN05444411_102239 [Lutibacter oricola]
MKNSGKINFTFLKELNSNIKSNDDTLRENAFKTLNALELQDQNPGIQMYAVYLMGKHHYLNAKSGKVLENYYKAHQSFKKVFKIARIHRVNVKNPKYYFKYAESALRLSQHVWCLHEQERLVTLAKNISDNSLKNLFPNSSSFKWLKNTLDS